MVLSVHCFASTRIRLACSRQYAASVLSNWVDPRDGGQRSPSSSGCRSGVDTRGFFDAAPSLSESIRSLSHRIEDNQPIGAPCRCGTVLQYRTHATLLL